MRHKFFGKKYRLKKVKVKTKYQKIAKKMYKCQELTGKHSK